MFFVVINVKISKEEVHLDIFILKDMLKNTFYYVDIYLEKILKENKIKHTIILIIVVDN